MRVFEFEKLVPMLSRVTRASIIEVKGSVSRVELKELVGIAY